MSNMVVSPFNEQDTVQYPCPEHDTKSSATFEYMETLDASEFLEYDDINKIDLDTFIRINDIDFSDDVRVYECDECSAMIAYFPDSGCQYVC